MNPTVSLRVADAPPPRLKPQFYSRTPRDMVEMAPKLSSREFKVWAVLLSLFPAYESRIDLPHQDELGALCGCNARTIRTSLDVLEHEAKLIVRFRDRARPYAPWVVELNFDFRGRLVLESPEPEVRGPQSTPKAKGKGKACTFRQESSAPPGNERPRALATNARASRQKASLPLLERIQKTEEDMMMMNPTALSDAPPVDHHHLPSTPDGDREQDPAEAPGTPQDGPAAGDVETPAEAAEDAAEAESDRLLAGEVGARAAERYPDLDREYLWSELLKLERRWRDGRRRDGEDGGGEPTRRECIEAVDLAVRYAANREAKSGAPKDWGYVATTINRWLYTDNYDISQARGEVKASDPKPPKASEPSPRKPVRIDPPEVAKAKADLMRAMVSRKGLEAARARLAELDPEAAAAIEAEAQEEGRSPGVSASPASGPECAAGGTSVS